MTLLVLAAALLLVVILAAVVGFVAQKFSDLVVSTIERITREQP